MNIRLTQIGNLTFKGAKVAPWTLWCFHRPLLVVLQSAAKPCHIVHSSVSHTLYQQQGGLTLTHHPQPFVKCYTQNANHLILMEQCPNRHSPTPCFDLITVPWTPTTNNQSDFHETRIHNNKSYKHKSPHAPYTVESHWLIDFTDGDLSSQPKCSGRAATLGAVILQPVRTHWEEL